MNLLSWFRRKPEPEPPMWGTVVGYVKDGCYLIELSTGGFAEGFEANNRHVLAGSVVMLWRVKDYYAFQYNAC